MKKKNLSRIPKNAGKIAVFGFTDSLTGQVINMIKKHTNYEIAFFISVKKIPTLNLLKQHKRNPNRKTEYVKKMKIFGKQIFYKKNYLEFLKEKKINKCFILEGNRFVRKEIYEKLNKNGIRVLSFVHPSVKLMGHNNIGKGVIIFPNCYIGYKTDVRTCSILETGCIVEHHSVIGNFCEINPKMITGGFTKINDFCEIHISVTIINRIIINKFSRIGAGSLVLKNCKKNSLYFGRPAKYVRKNFPHKNI